MKLTRAKRQASRPLPDTYFAWVARHPLTSIRSEAELDAAQTVLDEMLQKDLDHGEQAYLEALSDLVIVYEREHHSIPELPPHELLAQLLLDRGMSQADLVRVSGLPKATVSDLVTGKRSFTFKQMHLVAAIFGIPATIFMPRTACK
ncbi:MAG TPA: helix-turn-helix domain-containing protein, partial [Gemmataceae bacterium]|nr:helix-turn-helix domain-containing protein [Gemmataceae bacterium]